MSLTSTEACYFVLVGGGAVPWAHFSSLPRTPQAVRARNNGMAKPLRPGTDPAISWMSPNKPLELFPVLMQGHLKAMPLTSCR